MYLCHRKPTNNGLFLLTLICYIEYAETVSKCLWAADGQDGNGLQLEKLRLNFSSVSTRLQKIDINGRGLFSLGKLRLYLLLDDQR